MQLRFLLTLLYMWPYTCAPAVNMTPGLCGWTWDTFMDKNSSLWSHTLNSWVIVMDIFEYQFPFKCAQYKYKVSIVCQYGTNKMAMLSLDLDFSSIVFVWLTIVLAPCRDIPYILVYIIITVYIYHCIYISVYILVYIYQCTFSLAMCFEQPIEKWYYTKNTSRFQLIENWTKSQHCNIG